MVKLDRVMVVLGIVLLVLVVHSEGYLGDLGRLGIEAEQRITRVANGTVVRIIDGDTIDVQIGNSTERVRFLGIDTPELRGKHDPEDFRGIENNSCLLEWAHKAKEHVENELGGRQVNLVYDSEAGDRGYYGRLLRYIEVDGRDFTLHLVEEGYAEVYNGRSDFGRKVHYMKAELDAREESRGLWACN